MSRCIDSSRQLQRLQQQVCPHGMVTTCRKPHVSLSIIARLVNMPTGSQWQWHGSSGSGTAAVAAAAAAAAAHAANAHAKTMNLHGRADQCVAHLDWSAKAHAAASSVDHAHAINVVLLHTAPSQALHVPALDCLSGNLHSC